MAKNGQKPEYFCHLELPYVRLDIGSTYLKNRILQIWTVAEQHRKLIEPNKIIKKALPTAIFLS